MSLCYYYYYCNTQAADILLQGISDATNFGINHAVTIEIENSEKQNFFISISRFAL